jgi:ATP phosphoribosyltransferase regulatory subunit
MFHAPADGAIDHLFEAARLLRDLEARVIDLTLLAGYQEVVLPVLERLEVFASEEEQVVRFVDRQGHVMGLRADFTGPTARVVATRLRSQPVVRLCYRGHVFRNPDAGEGQRSELHQAGFELFDEGGPAADAEAIRLALRACDALGATGARACLGSAALVAALLPGATEDHRRALDRRDAGAIPVELACLLDFAGPPEVLERARRELPEAARPAIARLSAVVSELGALADRVVIDLAEVRPWAYYSGVVFDLFAPGFPSAIGGGGRYDGLVAKYGHGRPAVGASLAIEVIAAGLLTRPAEGGASDRGLTIALPKGRIRSSIVAALGDLAPDTSSLESRQLRVPGRAPLGTVPASFLLVKDPDIPSYVERGIADVGIVGLDTLEEAPRIEVLRPLALDLGRCRMSLCGKPGTKLRSLAERGNLRIATKYPKIARRALEERGLPAEIIPLRGSVELATLTGLADAIIDLVETGATLKANGLVELEELLVSTARVVVNRASWRLKTVEVSELLGRLARVAKGGGHAKT